jgi:hypothetical protein
VWLLFVLLLPVPPCIVGGPESGSVAVEVDRGETCADMATESWLSPALEKRVVLGDASGGRWSLAVRGFDSLCGSFLVDPRGPASVDGEFPIALELAEVLRGPGNQQSVQYHALQLSWGYLLLLRRV